jgi:acetolactate synthase I/II/III large subunit
MPTEITGGEAVYQALVKLGVRHVFGIPSVHNLPIFDAILRGREIAVIVPRHEQAAAHAADGYARASGRLGVVIASTGPGTTNTVTGIYEAAFASSKVMVITGQVESFAYGKGRSPGHEADHQLPMLRTVARRVESPRYTQDIATAVFRVAHDIESGRPQPGCIEIPIDIQYATTSVPVGEPITVTPVPPSADRINEAAELLSGSSRRVIIAGGGVSSADAGAELAALAERLRAPVFTSVSGRGAISDEHELAMGPLFSRRELQNAVADAEVVLAVGTRFQGGPGSWRSMPGSVIHIDVDPFVHGLVVRTDVSVIADAKLSLRALLEGMNAGPGDAEFLDRVSVARDQARAASRARIGGDMEAIMDHIRATSPRDAIIVRDMTTPAYAWANQILPILAPRTTMNPTSGAIGPALPLACGAALATGRKTVIVQGDGGFMLHIGELATAAQYDLPLVVCVFTDGGYGVLRGIQSARFEGRQIGVDLATPNFVKVAQGMGVQAEAVKGVDQFRDAFTRALATTSPVLLDIDMTTLTPMQGVGLVKPFTQPT